MKFLLSLDLREHIKDIKISKREIEKFQFNEIPNYLTVYSKIFNMYKIVEHLM